MDVKGILEKIVAQTKKEKNYQRWREEHIKIFGSLFADAFAEDGVAEIHLSAALMNISQRQFANAQSKLDLLESKIQDMNERDIAVLYYFQGLNHEMMGHEKVMEEYYEKVRNSSVSLAFPLAFHPYYRTAKFAQRDSECSKALFYYRKALDFYTDVKHDAHSASVAGFLAYDIATVFLYMHRHEDCDRFLEMSCELDPSENGHRNYVTAILAAVRGQKEECDRWLEKMSPMLRENCAPMVQAILAGEDPHYCIILQDRTYYGAFWDFLRENKAQLQAKIADNDLEGVSEFVGAKLTETLPFMKRELHCRVNRSGGSITVSCKNYHVNTLKQEYAALFAMKPQELSEWAFVSVEEFEIY